MNSVLLDLKKAKRIHFIGIGGISMSALASILHSRGWKVSGSDLNQTAITERLSANGITTYYGHAPENVADADLVVYTSAVKRDNPEMQQANELGVPIFTRAQLLGQLMAESECGIAIAGAHGKTTTTAMVGLLLDKANRQPTVLVGGELDDINGNVKVGNGKFLVAEACEYFDNFLALHPNVGVILNIDVDHLDYFRGLDHIKETFRRFAELVPPEGILIACADDDHVRDVSSGLQCRVVTYGLEQQADYMGRSLELKDGSSSYLLYKHETLLGEVKLRVPGRHNASNALAALATCSELGLSMDEMQDTMLSYRGTHRRFEPMGELNGARIFDDYAHHPSEVRATLAAASTYNAERVISVFQPHTYTRTQALLEDFAASFAQADLVLLTDIYAAREKDTYGVSSETLADTMLTTHPDARYIGSLEQAAEFLKQELRPGDLLITMGAGDVYRIADMLLDKKC